MNGTVKVFLLLGCFSIIGSTEASTRGVKRKRSSIIQKDRYIVLINTYVDLAQMSAKIKEEGEMGPKTLRSILAKCSIPKKRNMTESQEDQQVESQKMQSIKDALDSFEKEKDQKKPDLDNLVKIVEDLKQVELTKFDADKVPQELLYTQQYPLIGLLMTNCPQGKEKNFIGVLKSLVKYFNWNGVSDKLNFVHQVGKKIIERSVYGDSEAAENLVSEAFPPTLPVDEETLLSLFQAYACIGKTIEDTDSWKFFKAYLFIHVDQWTQYNDKILKLYSLDKLSKNLVKEGQNIMQTLPKDSYWGNMYVQ